MSEQRLWRWALILGVATFLCSRGFAYFVGLADCTPLRGWGAILSLEYARDATQAVSVLGNAACVSAQRGALWWDTLGFIPLYTGFLIVAANAAGGKVRPLTIALAVLGALGDWVESVVLFGILADPASGDYTTLIVAVRAKFTLLAVATVLIGGRLVQRRGWPLVPGTLMIMGGAVAAVSVMPDPRAPTIMPAMTLAWVALLVTALIMAFRRQPD